MCSLRFESIYDEHEFFFSRVHISQLHARGVDRASFSRLLLKNSLPTEREYFRKVFVDKNSKPEASKKIVSTFQLKKSQ